jgi:LacI family transcriptional regulator
LQKRLTIREIAHEAGVSIATVSRVLNQPETVASERREAVLAVVDRHHFVSHGPASSLASQKSRTIGLIIPTITNSIYASSTQAIQKVAQRAGYTVLLSVSEFDPSLEARLIRRLVERRVDGLILTGGNRSGQVYELLDKNQIPFIVTWKLTDGRDCPSVSFDNYHAGRLAIDHLLKLGHRRIGLICGRTDVNDRARERRRAYEESIREHGIAVESELIYERDFEFVEGRAAMQRMLETQQRPTAVFCANDIQAIGALQQCLDSGLSVPGDISIIGFDDLPVAQYVRPMLTTIHVPAQRMGHLAAERLLDKIVFRRELSTEELPVQLIIRQSTGPAASPDERRCRGHHRERTSTRANQSRGPGVLPSTKSKYSRCSSFVISPTPAVPTRIPSTSITGIVSAAVPARKISSSV